MGGGWWWILGMAGGFWVTFWLGFVVISGLAPAEDVSTGSEATATSVIPGASEAVRRGETLAVTTGCTGCHSVDGSVLVGPSWQGLFGSERTLADGNLVVADDEYVIESILRPDAKVGNGFSPGIMPSTYGDQLDPDEIQDLVEFIRSLR